MAGAYRTLLKVMMTPNLTITIYEIVSSCGLSAFLERQSGISQRRMVTYRTKVSCAVGTSVLRLRVLPASQRVEPLRAHKYPIPKEPHCGVQIKVSSSRSLSRPCRSPEQVDLRQRCERHSKDCRSPQLCWYPDPRTVGVLIHSTSWF